MPRNEHPRGLLMFTAENRLTYWQVEVCVLALEQALAALKPPSDVNQPRMRKAIVKLRKSMEIAMRNHTANEADESYWRDRVAAARAEKARAMNG